MRGKHTRIKQGKLNKKKFAIVLIILLLVLVLYVVFIKKNDEEVVETNTNIVNYIQENDVSNEISNVLVNDVDLKEYVDTDMPDYIQGYGVLGQIVIDEIDMENYILDSTDDYSLNLAVTKFYGPDLNQRGNFVITGHNARGLFNN